MQYKNTPKIKVLQMPRKWNMIFLKYLRISGTENTQGEQAPGHEGPGRAHPLSAPPASWAHGGSPPLIPATTHSFLPKKSPSSSSTSSSSFCCDFRSPCSKHLSQNYFGGLFLGMWILHWSISFCSSALFIANMCCLGDHVLELACQIYMVPSSSNAWYSL